MTFTARRGALHNVALALVVLLVPFALYFPAREFSFQFDDAIFLEDQNIRGESPGSVLWPPQTRMLPWLSLLIQYRLHGPDPSPFHLFNLFLHSLNGVLVFYLLIAILGRPSKNRADDWIAFGGALIFVLHPLQTEPVLYVFQRATLMASLFSFLALLFHRHKRPGASFLCFLPALFSKEFAVAVPVLLWLNDGLLEGRWRPRWNILAAVSSALGAVIVWLAATDLFPAKTSVWTCLAYAAGQVRALWKYLALTVIPYPLNIDHDLGATEMDSQWWILLTVLAGLGGLLFQFRRRYPMAVFFSLCYFILLLPSSSFLPRADVFFEHRIYTSLLGLSGLLCLAYRHLASSRFRRATWGLSAGCVLLIVCYVALDWARLWQWQSEVTLWKSAVERSPDKYRPNLNYGITLMDSDPLRALDYLDRAARMNPRLPQAFHSLGQVYKDLGREDEALQSWEKAVALAPRVVDIHLALGELYAARRDFLKARRHFAEAQALDPGDWRSYFQLAQLNQTFGFTGQVIIQSQLGLNLNPGHFPLRLLLADSMRRTENWDRALRLYQDLLEHNPHDSLVYFRIARTQWALGDLEAALAALEQGLLFSSSPSAMEEGLQLRRGIEAELR